ncbi:MAG: iron-containing alcohol dehydrogenase [Salinisphaera sp.]|nr:iron-containing alcohol dehydrogenase [Salinisphaera sp.]
MILPTVLRFNEEGCAEAYARIRQTMGLPEGSDLAREIEKMNAQIGLPQNLAAMGLSTDLIDDMVPHAVADLATRTNPRPVEADDFAQLFQAAM